MALSEPRLRIHVFGRPRLFVDGAEIALAVPPRTVPLLAYLALAAGKRVDRDALAAAFWPDVTDQEARANVRRHLHYLTQALSSFGLTSDLIERFGHSALRVDPELVWVDALAFEAAVREDRLDDAVRLYVADVLEPLGDEEWVRLVQVRYRDLYLRALERLIEHASTTGDQVRALGAVRRALTLDPYHEGLICTLMRLQREIGDRRGLDAEYRSFVRLLAADLGTEPLAETSAMHAKFMGLEDWNASAHLPPEATSFIGRELEIERLSELLARSRTVCLSGAPGVGKTRLALRVASAVGSRFRDGAYFVQLAAIADPRLVERAIALALGRGAPSLEEGEPSIEDAAKGLDALVVLDNCEHLKAECVDAIGRLLAASPSIVVLATSREVMRAPGEAHLRLEPLEVPSAEPTDAEAARSGAVRLFFERLRNGGPGGPTPRAVAEVVRRLDGLPLAIELAAARLGTMSFKDLADTLIRRTALLADRDRSTPQARSLAAAFAWSYDLLDNEERQLLRRCAVFRSGFTAEAAAKVCRIESRDEWSVFDLLAGLTDASLLVAPAPGDPTPRYALLQPIRDCAFELLEGASETESVREAHAQFYARWYIERNDALRGARAHEFFADLERDHDNVRAALTYLITEKRDVTLGLRLALAASRFWFDRGFVDEGSGWLERGLAAGSASAELRADVFSCLALITRNRHGYDRIRDLAAEAAALLQTTHSGGVALGKALLLLSNTERVLCRFAEARAAAEAARAAFAPSGDAYLLGYAAMGSACNSLAEGKIETARAEFREALRLYDECDAHADAALVMANLALCDYHVNSLEAALFLCEEALRLSREVGNRFYTGHALHTLALIEHARGSIRCRALGTEAMTIAREYADKELIVICIELGAVFACDAGQLTEAAALLGAVEAARDRFRLPRPPLDAPSFVAVTQLILAGLGRAAFTAAMNAGSALSLTVAAERTFSRLNAETRTPKVSVLRAL
jgi:predicted ATPase